MDRDGFFFAGIPLLLAIIFAGFHFWIPAGIFCLLAAFMLYFFRDPERSTPKGENLIVSSADGKVTRIEDRPEGKFVSVFLSPVDVHINRAPIAGVVKEVRLFKGLKRPATSDSASETNERNAVEIEGENMTVTVTQIVGILARRIVCRTKAGESLKTGERFGLIRFGSRTDLLMPSNVKVLVKPGDRVVGGVTVIAELPKPL